MYTQKIYLHFFSTILVIFGALLLGSIGITNKNYIGGFKYHKAIYSIIGLAGLYLLISRDSFLPFLSYGVVPCNVLSVSEPLDWTTEVELPAPEGSMVIYWAAEPSNRFHTIPDARSAYGSYNNSGVAVTQPSGFALAKIRYPTRYYTDNFGMKMESFPHIHYRYCMKNNPILSEVYSIPLN